MRSLLVIIAILCGLGVAWGGDITAPTLESQPASFIIDDLHTWEFKPSYPLCFSFGDVEKELGKLCMNEETMWFEGDVQESAKMFFNYVIKEYGQIPPCKDKP